MRLSPVIYVRLSWANYRYGRQKADSAALSVCNVSVYQLSAERYRIQSESFEDIWLIAKELVQRFDQHFSSLGVKDFRNSFTGPVPLSEYFETVDHHFKVQFFTQ